MRIVSNKVWFLLLCLATLLSSCVYEPVDGTVTSDTGTGVFKADFGGKTWTAKQTQVVISGNYIEISAIQANGEGFGFLVEANKAGTYAANINNLSFVPAGSDYGFWSLNDDNPDEDTGSITITKIDTEKKTISGTFKFKGYWTNPDDPKSAIQFTNGVFTDLPYITEDQTEDKFSAKVNGTSFVSTDIMAMTITSNAVEWIAIGAENASGNTIAVNVRSNLTAGTYQISSNTLTDKVQVSYEDATDEYQAVSGSITITSITADRVKGTFSFTTNGTSPNQITEGSFDVEY